MNSQRLINLWPSCNPTRPQHRERRALLFSSSVCVGSLTLHAGIYEQGL